MTSFNSFFQSATAHITKLVCILFGLFHLYTAGWGTLGAMDQRVIHITFILVLVFLNKPVHAGVNGAWRLLDVILTLVALAVGGYLYLNSEEIAFRLGIANMIDLAAGAALILLLMEATRRVIGWPLPFIAGTAILYGFFGDKLPGILAHGGFEVDRLISHLSLTTEGIFTVPLSVSATVVVIFIIFATFLNATGAGQYFIDLVMSYFGRSRGAPAKAAVVGSAMMGTLSGSVIANVMGTGSFTIPLMKRSGYRPVVAGAVEACTSTGGQIMPPIMGAAAFIIAEFLRVPYLEVIKAAVIPAILFYVALFIYVHLEAARGGLKALPDEEIREYRKRRQGKYYQLIPLVALVVMMASLGWSPTRSAFFAILITLAIGFIQKEGRLTFTKLIDMFRQAGMTMLEVATACATAGIIIGILSLTGLGLQLSSILTGIAGGNLMILLVLTMFVSLILGMGLTTTACYVILAVLVAPAIIKMGIDPMAAHLFVFYYGMYSFITPPVSLGAFAAAGISGSSPMATGYMAWKIALPGFILPFMFTSFPAMLMKGSWPEILYVTTTGLAGVFFISAATVGYFRRDLNRLVRGMMIVAGVLLVHGGMLTDVIGIVLGGATVLSCYLRSPTPARPTQSTV
ncbi:MAG: TRAP transporter permease [Pseudomonadota bacterium]|nr:MAG: TRAP transporter permease [Pseudomonadota bacterium]